MKLKTRTTLIAGAIAAMLVGPTWAGSYGAQTPAPSKAETGQPERYQPTAAQPMSETPRMGAAAQTTDPTKAKIGQPEVDSPIVAQPMSETPRMGSAQSPAPTKAEIGQPEVDSQIAAQPISETPRMGAAAYGGATATTSIGDNPLYTRSGDDLAGVEVVDSTGDKVGEVIRILLGPDRKSAHALISVGRIHGMGARDVMVSLDELKPMNDKLQMGATKAEIDLLKGETPDPDKYVEVKGNTSISGSIVEFSAFEQGKEADQPGATSRTLKGDTVKPAPSGRCFPRSPVSHRAGAPDLPRLAA